MIKENNNGPKSETTLTRDSDNIKYEVEVFIVRKCLRNILDVLRKTKETLNGAGGRIEVAFKSQQQLGFIFIEKDTACSQLLLTMGKNKQNCKEK